MQTTHRPLYIKNANLYLENEVFKQGSVLIVNGKIAGIYTNAQKQPPIPENVEFIDGMGLNLIPGFIDGHIHGAAGADAMDATKEALDTIAQALPKEGTTSFLATTMTQSPENIEKALKNVSAYSNQKGQAELLGVHLEGPFVEKSKAGAQPVEYIKKPNLKTFKKWQQLSGGKIKTVTLAPEHDEDGSFIKYLNETGVNASAGHTGIGYEGAKKAINQGIQQLTHFCNAMTGIHHRDIGLVGAAFMLTGFNVELITDGIHVSKEMLQLIYDHIGSSRIIMITDAMRAKGLEPGDYELGGQPVTVSEREAVLEDGTLAGSILKMNEGAQNMLNLQGVTLQNIIEMASVNPAKQINVYDRKGSIALTKDADLLLVDDHLNIKYTFCKGIMSYKGHVEKEKN